MLTKVTYSLGSHQFHHHGQLSVLDEVVWVALASVKDYKNGGFGQAVDTGVVQDAVVLADRWGTAELLLSNDHLSHQNLGEEHVLGQAATRRGGVGVGVSSVAGKVGTVPMRHAVDPGDTRVDVVVADVLDVGAWGPVEQVALQPLPCLGVTLQHVLLMSGATQTC